MRSLPILALFVAAAVALGACGSDDSTISTPTIAGDTSAADAAPQTTSTAASASSGCSAAQKPGAKDRTGKKPTSNLASGKTYTVVMQTNCGTIEIRLDTKDDPKTSASFASLVRSHFYDGLWFHRIVAGFVIQGGDPKGDGTGDAGYRVTEKPSDNTAYRKGVVAMAKGGNEPSGTSSSQFFIVSGADAGLPPDYAVAGRVVKGLDVVAKIAAIPTTADPSSGEQSVPTEAVVIKKATLRVSG